MEDLNWRSILVTSEISFEDQNPRYHLEDLNWRPMYSMRPYKGFMYLQPHYSNGVFGSVLKIKFVDQLWRSITSEISFEDQNPRYHLEDLDWRSISVTLDICSEDPIDGQVLRFQSRFFWSHFFGEKLKINLKIDYGDQLWRAI